MKVLPTKDNLIPLDPLPIEVIKKMLNELHENGFVTIAGVQWAHENTTMNGAGITISLYRSGSHYLETVAYEGTYIRNHSNDTMTVSANTLATMLGITPDKKSEANDGE